MTNIANGIDEPTEKNHENGIHKESDGKTLDDGLPANGCATMTIGINRREPPDGGMRAWTIMIASFLINGVLFGIINTYSNVFMELEQRLKENGESSVSSKSALVGSLAIGMTFFLSPISGILTDKIGIRRTTLIGGLLAASGMFMSSLLVKNVTIVALGYGVMYGVGASLAYTPSLVILGHYFKRRLGLVNGIATAGSSVFTTILPSVNSWILKNHGLEVTLRCYAVLALALVPCAVLFKPVELDSPDETTVTTGKKKFCTMIKETINTDVWRSKRYVVWVCAIPIALIGYFVPYVFIGKQIGIMFGDENKNYPIMCISVASGMGRLIFGVIADRPNVNKILLQQISFVSIGILTMLLPFASSYTLLLVYCVGMGLFDGCFISLLGPIAFEFCGQKNASQAIGCLLGICSFPLTAGPPLAGFISDITGNFDLAFLLAGTTPILGALAMCTVYRMNDNIDKKQSNENNEDVESLTGPKCQNGELKIVKANGEDPAAVASKDQSSVVTVKDETV